MRYPRMAPLCGAEKSGAAPTTASLSRLKSAVGLAYAPHEDASPKVSVKGSEIDAEEIVRIARRFGIPVVEQGPIARALGAVPIDTEIPPSLFEAVAVILAHLRRRPATP